MLVVRCFYSLSSPPSMLQASSNSFRLDSSVFYLHCWPFYEKQNKKVLLRHEITKHYRAYGLLGAPIFLFEIRSRFAVSCVSSNRCSEHLGAVTRRRFFLHHNLLLGWNCKVRVWPFFRRALYDSMTFFKLQHCG